MFEAGRFGARVVLAPMAGYTDAAMRSLCAEFGADCTYTEVVNAAGLVHGSRLTWHMLSTLPEEGAVVAHLYGSDPSVMAEAAAKVEAMGRFCSIDINCGCPVRKIVAKGAGVALMRSPERIAAIVAAIREVVALPVTIKTRIGLTPDAVNVFEVVAAAEAAGAAAVAVHARAASNHHRGPADWDLLAAVKARCGIPVIGNGGIDCAADVPRMLQATGVDAVMIGRAAVGRPWIFRDAVRLLAGEAAPPRTLAELEAAANRHLDRLIRLKDAEQKLRRRSHLSVGQAAALHFRAQLVRYLAGLDDWSDVRRQLNGLDDCDTIRRLLAMVVARQPG